jgi:hypothetical protein
MTKPIINLICQSYKTLQMKKKIGWVIAVNIMIALAMLIITTIVSNLHEANALVKKNIPAGAQLMNAILSVVGGFIVMFFLILSLRELNITDYWRKKLISAFVILPWMMFYIIDFIFPGEFLILLPTGISLIIITIFLWWMVIKKHAQPA